MSDLLQSLEGKVIAVTGASGYIGSALSTKLVEYSARVLRISSKELYPQTGMLDLKTDINIVDSWETIVNQADVIIHLAGNTSIYEAKRNYVGSLNSTILPLQHLDSIARKLNRKPRVVLASTATVYGLSDTITKSEDDNINPITEYDLHKVFAEQQLDMSTRNGVLDGVSLRLANVYGVSMTESSTKDRGIFNKITKTALQGKDITVYGDGNYVRDYVYIDDVVSAFLYAATAKNIEGELFNIATGVGYTIKEAFNLVSDKVGDIIKKKVNIHETPWPEGVSSIEKRNFIASIEKFKKFTGWEPTISLEDGIHRLVSFYANRNF
jgi:nucleoside-diphosphate-sugar epimerase